MVRTRSPKVADWLQKVLIISFVGVLVLLPLHAFISTWGGTTVGPLLVWKSWKEILLLLLVPIAIWFCVIRPDVPRALWHGWLNKLLLVYAGLNVVFAIFSQASAGAVVAGLLFNLRFFAMFVLAEIIFYGGHPWLERVKRWLPTWLFATTIFLALFAIAQVSVLPKDFLAQFGYNKDTTIQPYFTVDENPNALRAFATMRGPNPLGSYLLLALGLSLVTVVKQRRNVLAGLALGLGTVALVLTTSRSAWLGAISGLVVLALTLVKPATLIKWIKWGTIPVLVTGALFLWLATTVPAIRLAVFHSRPDRPTLTTGSDDKHWQEVANGLKDAAAHPLGQGVGIAGPASFYNTKMPAKIPENYFVQLAQELGFAGMALFIAINALVAFKLWQRQQTTWGKALLASLMGLTVINLFLHGWADDPTAMTWWGIAGLYLFADNKK